MCAGQVVRIAVDDLGPLTESDDRVPAFGAGGDRLRVLLSQEPHTVLHSGLVVGVRRRACGVVQDWLEPDSLVGLRVKTFGHVLDRAECFLADAVVLVGGLARAPKAEHDQVGALGLDEHRAGRERPRLSACCRDG